jgi:hypothetical protein
MARLTQAPLQFVCPFAQQAPELQTPELPSGREQGVPSETTGLLHAPVSGSQVPATWH